MRNARIGVILVNVIRVDTTPHDKRESGAEVAPLIAPNPTPFHFHAWRLPSFSQCVISPGCHLESKPGSGRASNWQPSSSNASPHQHKCKP